MATEILPVSLLELNRRVAAHLSVPELTGVWVAAETSDVSVRGGHCYLELIQKDDRGMPLARARAAIWANNYQRLAGTFERSTGQRFATGLRVLVRVTASMHAVYGLSLVISDIDPSFTAGDLERRRREILARLKEEGVIDNNRTLQWPDIPSRIAVVSAPAAAGYGDFINQLILNPSKIRFNVELFPAVMQGERAPRSIIASLDEINAQIDRWDCVVIIRGGGATSDLQAFEDYDLAANVANFPIPVIIGIGHERDITVLDWVANMRVKTPTAAAEWLINRSESLLTALRNYGSKILQTATDRIAGSREQLSHCQGMLPIVPVASLGRAQARLTAAATALSGISGRRISPALERLSATGIRIAVAARQQIADGLRASDSRRALLEALSPTAVLRRGYSITRAADGRLITSAAAAAEAKHLKIQFADSTVDSTVAE